MEGRLNGETASLIKKLKKIMPLNQTLLFQSTYLLQFAELPHQHPNHMIKSTVLCWHKFSVAFKHQLIVTPT